MIDVREFFNGIAPQWDNLERRSKAEIKEFLVDNVALPRGTRLLDIGCGTGVADEALYSITGRRITALDLSEEMINRARLAHSEEIAEYIVANYYFFTRSPFEAIVCYNAYPHFVDTERFVKKSAELLVKGGKLFILHNIGRTTLSAIHAGIPDNISRNLLPAVDEVKPFLAYFDVERIADDENTYILQLIKK